MFVKGVSAVAVAVAVAFPADDLRRPRLPVPAPVLEAGVPDADAAAALSFAPGISTSISLYHLSGWWLVATSVVFGDEGSYDVASGQQYSSLLDHGRLHCCSIFLFLSLFLLFLRALTD